MIFTNTGNPKLHVMFSVTSLFLSRVLVYPSYFSCGLLLVRLFFVLVESQAARYLLCLCVCVQFSSGPSSLALTLFVVLGTGVA